MKSNHHLAPFTSTPIIGTKINNKKNKENRGIASLLSKDVSIAEIKNIIHKAKNVNIRCFEKKSSKFYLVFRPLMKTLKKKKKKDLKQTKL